MGQMKTYTFKRSTMTPDCLVGFEDGEQFFHTSFTDYEADNQKIFHEIWHLSLPEKYIFMMDWSPYSMPESLDLEMFFALGCPSRFTINDGKESGNLTRKRLVEAMGRDLCITGY